MSAQKSGKGSLLSTAKASLTAAVLRHHQGLRARNSEALLPISCQPNPVIKVQSLLRAGAELQDLLLELSGSFKAILTEDGETEGKSSIISNVIGSTRLFCKLFNGQPLNKLDIYSVSTPCPKHANLPTCTQQPDFTKSFHSPSNSHVGPLRGTKETVFSCQMTTFLNVPTP